MDNKDYKNSSKNRQTIRTIGSIIALVVLLIRGYNLRDTLFPKEDKKVNINLETTNAFDNSRFKEDLEKTGLIENSQTVVPLEIEQILDLDEFLDNLVVEKRPIQDENKTYISDLSAKIDFPEYLSNFTYEDVLNNKLEYQGKTYVEVNGNRPLFTKDEILAYSTESFEVYSDLDELGRCGVALGNIGKEIMPTKKRESIRDIKPSGFRNKKYEGLVEDDFIYNRSHLIAHSLAGENANERNLITGTRYFNAEGMEPFESMTTEYIKSTSNHVLYRVTPIFKDDELVARGVLMEAYSLEDKGKGIQFCVYVFNVQPGIDIDYKTGKSYLKK